MQLNPTTNANALALVAGLMVAVGVAFGIPAAAAWGGSIVVGLALARAVTQLNVAKIRSAGFEMLWREETRYARVARGQRLELKVEVRNRDIRAARYAKLSVIANPNLRVTVDPSSGEVPASGRLAVTLSVETLRVGRHGVHGLSLQVQGGPGLFEVPLAFANPFVIEVLPEAYASLVRNPSGGRSRRQSEYGASGRERGESGEFAEIREHQSGDPFKRIAWRASARRGKLLVRDYDLEERANVWLVLDASLELWSGLPGQAPLDLAIDDMARLAEHHIRKGDSVGLAIVGARTLGLIEPASGPRLLGEILVALALDTQTYDTDRSGLDEADAAARVLEHMRSLNPHETRNLHATSIERIASAATRLLSTRLDDLSLPQRVPLANSERERALRQYLLAFGIASPARLEPDRSKTDLMLLSVLRRLCLSKPRGKLVYVGAPLPDPITRASFGQGLRELPKRRIFLHWLSSRFENALDALGADPEKDADKQERRTLHVVTETVKMRMRSLEDKGERALRQLGVRLVNVPGLRTQPTKPSATIKPAKELEPPL